MFKFFSSPSSSPTHTSHLSASTPPLQTDIHSHLLPGIDDGVQTWEEALQIVKGFVAMGYTKLIITPHIMSGFYP
ncbi:MAG TPA: hypothetical protein DCM08_01490, partial [Microscillaceae bacterium]|nr:hypothetical protein [Microscillaceae bacterium]